MFAEVEARRSRCSGHSVPTGPQPWLAPDYPPNGLPEKATLITPPLLKLLKRLSVRIHPRLLPPPPTRPVEPALPQATCPQGGGPSVHQLPSLVLEVGLPSPLHRPWQAPVEESLATTLHPASCPLAPLLNCHMLGESTLPLLTWGSPHHFAPFLTLRTPPLQHLAQRRSACSSTGHSRRSWELAGNSAAGQGSPQDMAELGPLLLCPPHQQMHEWGWTPESLCLGMAFPPSLPLLH